MQAVEKRESEELRRAQEELFRELDKGICDMVVRCLKLKKRKRLNKQRV